MAYRHIVIFEADEDAPLEEVNAAFERCGVLLRAIPGVRNFAAGLTCNPFADVRRYATTMEFDTHDAFRAYVAHENHKKAVDQVRQYVTGSMNAMLEV